MQVGDVELDRIEALREQTDLGERLIQVEHHRLLLGELFKQAFEVRFVRRVAEEQLLGLHGDLADALEHARVRLGDPRERKRTHVALFHKQVVDLVPDPVNLILQLLVEFVEVIRVCRFGLVAVFYGNYFLLEPRDFGDSQLVSFF